MSTSFAKVRRGVQQGFTLIELMISMLLGLLIVGAALMIFLSNQQVQRATQGVGGIQESLQISFELLARDVRAAGVNACDNALPTANVVNAANTNWWTHWEQPFLGYAEGALDASADDSDALQMLLSDGTHFNVQAHTGTTITLDSSAPYVSGDVLMVCDMRQLALFRTNSGAGTSYGHPSGAGNCSNSLNTVPAACNASAPPYLYGLNAQVTRLQGVRWYVAGNGRGTRSLYRQLNNGAAEEMVEGLSRMKLRYLQEGVADYQEVAGVTNWGAVTAIEVVLTATDDNRAGSNGQSFQRTVTNIINLRGRTL